jgi:BlaI family transcriptional regulator, penicillinase repressor
MPAQRPSDLEMQVLMVLWEHGPATVRQILDLLTDGKTRAYTTVLTVMQGMDRKGLVTRTQEGTAHVFHPAVERDEVVHPVMRTMLRNLFGGDPSKAVQALLDSSDISAETLRQVRRVIEEADRSQKENES